MSMESVGAGIVTRRSSVHPPGQPLRWIGADRVLLDDITIYGLRRWVVARRGEPPEVGDLLGIVEGMTQAEVYAWCVEKDDGYWYLWMVWKEPTQ